MFRSRRRRIADVRDDLVALIVASPVAQVLDPTLLARLAEPDFDPTLDELGIDSLSALTLTIDVAERLGVTLTEAELQGGTRLSELARMVASA